MNPKKKIFRFLLSILLTLSMILALSISTCAADTLPNLGRIKVKVTNLVEPVVGQTPSFNYNAKTYNQYNSTFSRFYFIAWLEVDLPYEEFMDYISSLYDSINSGSQVDYEYINELYNTARTYFNYDVEEVQSLASRFPPEEFDKFIQDKTYIAIFIGQPERMLESVMTGDLNNNVDSLNGINANTSLGKQIIISDSYDLDLSVNGETDNIIGQYSYDNNILLMGGVFTPIIPSENLKATVNWVDSEGHIPDSLILKLMNGSTVVKEQTVTKSNAVQDGVWEYTFEDVPTLDEDGNEITYTLAYEEVNEGDLKFFNTTVNGFTIDNTYIAPEITSKVKMRSIVDREENNVKYKIDYSASIKKYSGDANIEITTTLPFAINEEKSDLDGGTYDAKTRSITWKETIEDIDKKYDYSTTKNVDLYATAVLPYSIEATTVGEIKLANAEDFSDTVDTVDIIESSTGNPKTGDNNLVKYLSLGLIGIAAILMVFSIKRKYSTKKSKVQY